MINLFQLMQKTGLNRNQISKISGISNTLLAKIERIEKSGRKISLRRKTLINIAVSLNLKLSEINMLLSTYGHDDVSTSDTLYFLAASENQTITGMLPLFSSLSLEWFLIGMEKQLASVDNATMAYTLDQPSHVLESPEHTHFLNELRAARSETSAVFRDMMVSAGTHRRKLITEALRRGNKVNTYICAGCFERYLRRWEEHTSADITKKHKAFIKEHIETLIGFIETYPGQYNLYLLTKCPQLRYELLYLPERGQRSNAEPQISKLLFLGHESECTRGEQMEASGHSRDFNQGFGDHIGFATDVQNMLDFFHKQHAGLAANFVDRRLDDPQKMARHLRGLLSQHI